MPTIRIDDEVYAWLKLQAVPFEDTPNTVLRKFAGLSKRITITGNEPKDLGKAKANNLQETEKGIMNRMTKQRGKYLARLWKVNVVHALYHHKGTYFHHLRDFPGALFDPNGYVVFSNEKDYVNSPYLQHGQELHVPNGIASIPGYKRAL